MSRVFCHSVIHGLGFFICFDIDFTRCELKQRHIQTNKLTGCAQFNKTKVLHASSSKLSAASQRTPSQIFQRKCLSPSLKKMLTRGNVAKNNKHAFSMFYTLKKHGF